MASNPSHFGHAGSNFGNRIFRRWVARVTKHATAQTAQRAGAKGATNPAQQSQEDPNLPREPKKPYRILIADDHGIVRRGLRALLDSQPGLEVCAEASTGIETMERVQRYKPDLLMLDLTMPELNGLEVAREIHKTLPETAVLILSMHFSEEVAREVLRCGALGYVLKSDADVELLSAIDHVRHKQPFFTSRLALSMAQNYVDAATEGGGQGSALPGSPLTPREVQVVQLLAEGKSNKQVASVLGVSTRTIESHRNHIMHKMSFASFSEMIRFAVRNNLVSA
jgi:DNA-binding NarL/FixJ family response regulator